MNFKRKYSIPQRTNDRYRPILQLFNDDKSRNSHLRIVQVSFHLTCGQICCADFKGNIYLIDLSTQHYWLVNNLGLTTFVDLVPHRPSVIMAGTLNHDVHYIEGETGLEIAKFTGHKDCVKFVSFSEDGKRCLTASTVDAIVWCLTTFCILHALDIKSLKITNAKFIPVSDNIVVSFVGDVIHVWDSDSCTPVKRIIPKAWKGKSLSVMSFSKNGRTLALGGKCSNLILLSVDTWDVKHVVNLTNYHTHSIKCLEFVSQANDGGANRFLAILTQSQQIVLYDCEKNRVLYAIEHMQPINKFTISSSGKYFITISHVGQLTVYLTETLLKVCEKTMKIATSNAYEVKNVGCHFKFTGDSLKKYYQDLVGENACSQPNLKLILFEHGEYPELYRATIWRELLHLPYNHHAYCDLVKRDCHFAYRDITKKYPVHDQALRRHFQKVLSCLAHWCPLFGHTPNLSYLVYPFVQVFRNCPISCFEAIMMILVNWCQRWFTDFPFPPTFILKNIEQILEHVDHELLSHFTRSKTRCKSYAWQMLESGFAEVLSQPDWLRFWDHVISNEPAFFLLAVVAYNLVMKNVLMTITRHADFEAFYCNTNAINMKLFLDKCYYLLENLPESIHPRNYLKMSVELPSGSYPVFSDFPLGTLAAHELRMNVLCDERDKIEDEQKKLLDLSNEQMTKMQKLISMQEEESRLADLKTAYLNTLRTEEEELIERRNRLDELRAQLMQREVDILNNERDTLMRQHYHEKRDSIDAKMSQLEQVRNLREKFNNIDAMHQREMDDFNVRVARGLLHMNQEYLRDPNKGDSIQNESSQRESSDFDLQSSHLSIKLQKIDELLAKIDDVQNQNAIDALNSPDSNGPSLLATERVNRLLSEVDALRKKLI